MLTKIFMLYFVELRVYIRKNVDLYKKNMVILYKY